MLGPEWARRWSTRWKFDGGPVVYPVRDLASLPVRGAQPVRRFSWRTSQFHRPGLQYMVSTGRHHGFESHAEQQLLLALDFAGELIEVLSQPFRLTFTSTDGPGDHIPDFLAVTRGGPWLIDVRPESGSRRRTGCRSRPPLRSPCRADGDTRWCQAGGLTSRDAGHVVVAAPAADRPARPAARAAGRGPEASGVRRAGGRDRGCRRWPARSSAPDLGTASLGVDLAAPLTDRCVVPLAGAADEARRGAGADRGLRAGPGRAEWRVERLEPYRGRVALRPAARPRRTSPADHDPWPDAPPGLPAVVADRRPGSGRGPGAPARYVERPE